MTLSVGDLSLLAAVQLMFGSEEAWDAVTSYCEEMLRAKKVAERESMRHRTALAPEEQPEVEGRLTISGHHKKDRLSDKIGAVSLLDH